MRFVSTVRFSSLALALAMCASPAHSTGAGQDAFVEALNAQSKPALDASEKRVKAWHARQDVATLKARADGGDAAAQVQFADRIRDELLPEIWSRKQNREAMMKYYAMAMAQKHAAAFARVGLLAESVDYGMRDLNEALAYYEQGAQAGNRDAVAGYVRIAFDPAFCSFCNDGTYKEGVDPNKFLGSSGMDPKVASTRYREEKRAMVAKAVDFAIVTRPAPGDVANHLLVEALQKGIPVPQPMREKPDTGKPANLANLARAAQLPQWLLEPDLQKAVTYLSNMSGRGDILASRKLGNIYLTGRSGSAGTVEKDHGLYQYYMKRAVDQGSTLAAYELGYSLLSGQKIAPDHAKGFEYMAKAALAGFGPAQLGAGYALREGRGIEKNEALALVMLERAADNGVLEAAEQAAAMHRAGQGTPNGRVQVPLAAALEKKAASIKAMNPLMADAVRRAHWDKFE